MTLIRFVQRATILAGITFAGVAFHGGSATAQTEKFCVVASNGKTACGTLKAVERACVSTDNGVVCGKFKSVASEQGQEAAKPISENAPRAIVNNIAFSLKGCNRSDTTIKCVLSIVNKRRETYITISGREASITDISGKTYKGSNAEIGGNSGKNTMQVAPEIDYEASITFENIPASTKKAQILSFPFESKTVNFRNITLPD